jgi:hypothetical protein
LQTLSPSPHPNQGLFPTHGHRSAQINIILTCYNCNCHFLYIIKHWGMIIHIQCEMLTCVKMKSSNTEAQYNTIQYNKRYSI